VGSCAKLPNFDVWGHDVCGSAWIGSAKSQQVDNNELRQFQFLRADLLLSTPVTRGKSGTVYVWQTRLP
jgi:hypothetical protein